MTSKEFIPLNRPTPTSFPIHLSWSPCMWFLPGTFESRRDISHYGLHLLAFATKFISPQILLDLGSGTTY
jgi:hypothetical protein